MLKLHDLSVEFDEGFQLKHINWQIEQHQHWLITGANGAGKSALAAVLVGYGDILAGH
ncbi:MAG: ATP-binding cassette domain-containing protein [Oceanospirillaceae bacterium]|nr:ATP-binding cassette domain-containing protein [Oceanospirillaceae bacterium]